MLVNFWLHFDIGYQMSLQVPPQQSKNYYSIENNKIEIKSSSDVIKIRIGEIARAVLKEEHPELSVTQLKDILNKFKSAHKSKRLGAIRNWFHLLFSKGTIKSLEYTVRQREVNSALQLRLGGKQILSENDLENLNQWKETGEPKDYLKSCLTTAFKQLSTKLESLNEDLGGVDSEITSTVKAFRKDRFEGLRKFDTLDIDKLNEDLSIDASCRDREKKCCVQLQTTRTRIDGVQVGKDSLLKELQEVTSLIHSEKFQERLQQLEKRVQTALDIGAFKSSSLTTKIAAFTLSVEAIQQERNKRLAELEQAFNRGDDCSSAVQQEQIDREEEDLEIAAISNRYASIRALLSSLGGIADEACFKASLEDDPVAAADNLAFEYIHKLPLNEASKISLSACLTKSSAEIRNAIEVRKQALHHIHICREALKNLDSIDSFKARIRSEIDTKTIDDNFESDLQNEINSKLVKAELAAEVPERQVKMFHEVGSIDLQDQLEALEEDVQQKALAAKSSDRERVMPQEKNLDEDLEVFEDNSLVSPGHQAALSGALYSLNFLLKRRQLLIEKIEKGFETHPGYQSIKPRIEEFKRLYPQVLDALDANNQNVDLIALKKEFEEVLSDIKLWDVTDGPRQLIDHFIGADDVAKITMSGSSGILRKFGSQIEYLDGESVKKIDHFLRRFLYYSTNLKGITLSEHSLEGCTLPASLESLVLAGNINVSDGALRLAGIENCIALKELDVSSTNLTLNNTQLPASIEILDLQFCKSIRNLKNILSSCPNLREFRFGEVNEFYPILNVRFPSSLESLTLRGNYDCKNLSTSMKECSQLKEITWEFSSPFANIDDLTVPASVKKMVISHHGCLDGDAIKRLQDRLKDKVELVFAP